MVDQPAKETRDRRRAKRTEEMPGALCERTTLGDVISMLHLKVNCKGEDQYVQVMLVTVGKAMFPNTHARSRRSMY